MEFLKKDKTDFLFLTLIISLFTIILCSCDIGNNKDKIKTMDDTKYSNYEIVVIDSCEYITCKFNTNFLIHKANCINCRRIKNKTN